MSSEIFSAVSDGIRNKSKIRFNKKLTADKLTSAQKHNQHESQCFRL
jgi:hypothetical protein